MRDGAGGGGDSTENGLPGIRDMRRDAPVVVELDPRRRRDRRRFVDLTFELAARHPPWQPGLRVLQRDLVHPGKNPFWGRQRGSFFLARAGGRTLGRMAVIDPGSLPGRPGAAVLAFPDFVDDARVSGALFHAVERRARERGAVELVGPLNPDIHHDVGIQIRGYDRRNAAFMGYQPAYYRAHFEEPGALQPLVDFEAWRLEREDFPGDPRVERLERRAARSHALRIRPVDLGRFDRELRLFHTLYSGAFADHWGFAPPTWEEFRFLAADLRHVLRARMALVAEWAGEPAGFVLGIPDFYEILPPGGRGRLTPALAWTVVRRWRRIREARVMIAGVLPRFRHRGLHLSMFARVAREIFDLGYRGGEISWVLADHEEMRRALTLLGARSVKAYRVYRRPLHQ